MAALSSASLDLTTVFSVGQDQPGTYGFTAGAVAALDVLGLTSDQVAITHAHCGRHDHRLGRRQSDLHDPGDGAGQLTFTLIDQIDHVDSPNDAETNLPIDLAGVIQVVDEDGDALVAGTGDIVINVGDDIPLP